MISLPVLPADHPRRLTPTDVTQFVRLEQCERFLRFRLAERAGQDFMQEYGVIPQRITPLLSLSGHTFEEGIEADLALRLATVNYAAKYAKAHNRPENNIEVVDEARKLLPGHTVLLFQPRLEVELAGWRLRGDVDLVRLERTAEGTLRVERTAILVSATESDRAYLLASSAFLLDPRRLTVAVSRAKRKMILVASRNIFSMFSPDEETFTNSLLWKNLLLKTCSTLLWKANGTGSRWPSGVGRASHNNEARHWTLKGADRS